MDPTLLSYIPDTDGSPLSDGGMDGRSPLLPQTDTTVAQIDATPKPTNQTGNPNCTPDTCKGCCGIDGVCQTGTENLSCGLGGASCQNCTTTAMTCVSHRCSAPCSPRCNGVTCGTPNGCGGLCQPGSGCQSEPPPPQGCPASLLPQCSCVPNGGTTFVFCTTGKNYGQAQADCKTMGLNLAKITNGTQHTWMWTTSQTKLNGRWWFGISDKTTEGTWRYADGTVATYLPWHTDEPNGGTEENCAEMGWYGDKLLDDYSCDDNAIPFICN